MEIKTIKLQGRDYVQVVERLKAFRAIYPKGSIKTDYKIIEQMTAEGKQINKILFTAEIYVDDKLISRGSALKPLKSEFDFEKCETRAIGRALGIFGIGIDASISTYDEVREALGTEVQDG